MKVIRSLTALVAVGAILGGCASSSPDPYYGNQRYGDGYNTSYRDSASSGYGTIESIHTQLLRMRDEGVAILLVSVELEEVRALADRIIVMSGGRITGELKIEEFDTTRIGLLMGGMHKS